MGTAEGVGEPRPYGEAEPGKAFDEIAEQRPLARIGRFTALVSGETRSQPDAAGRSEKMGDAGDVDPQPILAIEVPSRTIASAPANEARETDAILTRVSRQRDQRRQRRPCVGERRRRRARAKPAPLR